MTAKSGAEPTPVVDQADVIDVTLTTDTSIYADGDVLADSQEVTSFFRIDGGSAEVRSIVLLDESDQGVALDVVFLAANASLGTENSAPNISDANARNIIGRVRIAATDYIDIGGSQLAHLVNVGLMLKAAAGTSSVWVGAITRGGTPTYAATALKLKIGLRHY